MIVKKFSADQIKKEIASIKKEIKPPLEEEVIIGENRKQLFVRIPRKVASRLELKKGYKFIFKIYTKNEKEYLEVEVKNVT
ncbi:MAG: hypothetical protein WC758_02970 [Candidatus Woesearchaeota archaeon]|jgi:hypothetical protein